MAAFDVQLEHVTKTFGETVAVDDLSLDVNEGEFLCLLGPSGCGKTTLLRMLAGLEEPTSGTIRLKDETVNGVPAYERDVAMVFQNWALFPHKTIFDNIYFGLKMKGIGRDEGREKVTEYLDLVRLPGLEERMPSQLSGGMQQRVALARALIIEPALLLMDEPLSNLDLKLRQQMRVEIRQIQKRLNITTVFVTHDQSEALEMADRVVVLNQGRIEQVGTAIEVYENPKSEFVADFVGESNFFEGSITSAGPTEAVFTSTDGLAVTVPSDPGLDEGRGASLSIRPQLIRISSDTGEPLANSFEGEVELQTYLGTVIRYHVNLGNGSRVFVDSPITPGETFYSPGDRLTLGWSVDASVCFPRSDP